MGQAGLRAEWVWNFASPTSNSVLNINFAVPQLVTTEATVNWNTTPFVTGVPADRFAVRLTGVITLPSSGSWQFRMTSDDGSRLWIDGAPLINNDGLHGATAVTGTITLAAGAHALELRYFEWTGGNQLRLEWRPPGGAWAVVPASAFSQPPAPLFVDVSASRSFTVTTSSNTDWGSGACVADLDGDGWLDVWMTGESTSRVMWNPGAAAPWVRAVFTGSAPRRQGVVGDFDNDGDVDLWSVAVGNANTEATYQNLGPRSFSSTAGLGMASQTNNEAAAAADTDSDGRLDLVMFSGNANGLGINTEATASFGSPAYTFTNNTGASFGLNTAGNIGDGDYVSAADVNGDGLTDFFYHYSGGRLFLSNGDGTYTRNNLGISVHTNASNKFGSAWGDYDNDGDMDLFAPDHRNGQRGRLWRNDGATFTEVGLAAGLTDTSQQRSCCWGDVDNDGDLDLFITNDNSALAILYFNNGNGTFTRGAITGAEVNAHSKDAVFADIDHDGDLDLIVTRTSSNAVLLVNQTNNAASLTVGFLGRGENGTNAAGVGVVIELLTEAGALLARRELGTARGYGGTEPLRAHFGGVDPTATYAVRARLAGGGTVVEEVTPGAVSATIGGTVIPRMLLLEEPRGVRIVRWREISPVDGD